MILTRKERHAIQVVPPLCGDFDSLAFAVLCFWGEACHLRVGNEFLDVLRMDCVQNRVEVCPVREPIFRIGVLHVLHDALVQCKLWEDVASSKLIKLGHVAELALAHLQKLLLAVEDLAKEVSVARRGRRNIVLNCKSERENEREILTMVTHVCQQVLLRAELVLEFAGAEGCFVVPL